MEVIMSDLIVPALKRIPGVIDASLVGFVERTGIAKYRITSTEPFSDGGVSDLEMMLASVHPDVWAVTLRMVRNGRIYHELVIRYATYQAGMDLRY